MNRLHTMLFILSQLLLSSCDTGMIQPGEGSDPLAARQLRLSGTVFRLGSDDGGASPEERPGWTRFGHDVWMDATEMTQAEYASLLGRNPSARQGDSLPVTDVSWFDAALAANARSRRDGLDTVYDYASVQTDRSGNALDIAGLAIHLERSGWRLPTEAEWEAAARAGTTGAWSWGGLADSSQAGAYAWFAGNAAGSTHAVASKKPNAWGLFDMAGNVMEWVNDWKGAFPRDTVDNYAGLESPGDVAEVPLKGGSYNYGSTQLRPSNRTATYAAYRSSRAEYVGFRLCRGGFAARRLSASGHVVNMPPVTLLRSDVARILDAWSARLVFVNRANGRGILTWIDYGEPVPVARSLPDRDPVFHPVISPDGQWVAWSTALEGSTGASRIKARRLAKGDTTVLDLGVGAIPRWWVSGADTFLVRASALDNLSPSWPATTTRAQRWSGGALTGSVETWVADGGYHDGRSGSYLYTGYRRLRQHDLRGGSSRVLFTGPGNGKGAGDTSQVCNVSASPDGSGRVLFLDFGYTGVSGVVGRGYGVHEIAFVADSTGRVLKTLASPAGEAQWEHMEWSNAPRWAVSGAIDGTGAYRNLYLVDVAGTDVTRIASGEQLWQPALWVGPRRQASTGGVSTDSAGAYQRKIDPSYKSRLGDALLLEFAAKTTLFWEARDSLDVLFLGSSRIRMGLKPSAFGSGRAFNFGVSGNELYTNAQILEKYVLPGAPRLKLVVMDFIASWFSAYDGRTQGYANWAAIENSWGYAYDRSNDFWADTLPEAFRAAVRRNRPAVAEGLAPWGEENTPSGRWGAVPMSYPETIDKAANPITLSNLRLLEEFTETLERKGIRLLLVNFPVNPAYRNTPYADMLGPTWPIYDSLLGMVKRLESKHRNFRFYDANLGGLHDYASSDAFDDGHLSGNGAVKLTRRIDSIAQAW